MTDQKMVPGDEKLLSAIVNECDTLDITRVSELREGKWHTTTIFDGDEALLRAFKNAMLAAAPSEPEHKAACDCIAKNVLHEKTCASLKAAATQAPDAEDSGQGCGHTTAEPATDAAPDVTLSEEQITGHYPFMQHQEYECQLCAEMIDQSLSAIRLAKRAEAAERELAELRNSNYAMSQACDEAHAQFLEMESKLHAAQKELKAIKDKS